MPSGVEDFLVEVEAVDAYLVLFSLVPRVNFARLQDRLRLDDVLRRLHRHVLFRVAVEDSEEVVVTAGHYGRVGAVPATLELIENAIVLVERTEFCSQIFMNLGRGERGGIRK
jgi:hypothetical protein